MPQTPSIVVETAADPDLSVSRLRGPTLGYVSRMAWAEDCPGRYRYSETANQPTLYASTYAAMTRHLYRDLDSLGDADRREWIAYLQSFQDVDGLFRDPVIFGRGMYAGDPTWCGRPHLSHHVITALQCLGGVPQLPFRWLDQFKGAGSIEAWLASRNWAQRPAWVGNEVMNVGCLLQYARDIQEIAQVATSWPACSVGSNGKLTE
jgi:hypothetical protein